MGSSSTHFIFKISHMCNYLCSPLQETVLKFHIIDVRKKSAEKQSKTGRQLFNSGLLDRRDKI